MRLLPLPIATTQQQPCRILIPHGIGWIGKSTLLKTVTAELQESQPAYFDKHAYASVSLRLDQTQMRTLQEVLCEHLIGSKCNFYNEEVGRTKLLEELVKLTKPFLLAIDNALENERLQLLPDGLERLLGKSVIVVTTRDASVGNELKRKGIKLEESREPLHKAMDECLAQCVEEEKLGSLLRVCDGHPLALTIAANYINGEVEDMSRDVGEKCKYVVESMRKWMGDKRICEGKLIEALAYSINTLPSDSKTAFLDIVAILAQPSEKMFSWDEVQDIVGVDAFKKLCNRSLVNKTRNGGVSIHDLLRRLALGEMPEGFRLGSFEELQPLLQQQEKLQQIEVLDLDAQQCKNLLLRQNLSTDMFELPFIPTNKLQFLCISDSSRLNLFLAANFNFTSLVKLRIEITMMSSTTLPEDLWNILPSLEYLCLIYSDVLEALPEKCEEELTRLKTLDLRGCKALKTLPEDLFCNLTSSRYLDLSGCEIGRASM